MARLHYLGTLPPHALSVRQPWAELIMAGRKRFELRTWETSHRGPLTIHAGLRIDLDAGRAAGLASSGLPVGTFVGVVEVVECSPFTQTMAEEMVRAGAYFGEREPGLFAWELANPVRLLLPVPARGSMGLFRTGEATMRRA